jgi:hypothetical protein
MRIRIGERIAKLIAKREIKEKLKHLDECERWGFNCNVKEKRLELHKELERINNI